jgi:hypothetical protein
LVVRLDKNTGAFEEKRVANLDTAFSAFKAALYLWKVDKVDLFQTKEDRPAAVTPDTAMATAASPLY